MAESVDFRDFTGWDMRDHPALIPPPGGTVRGSCFAQEAARDGQNRVIFSSAWRNVRFIGCNLDNAVLPTGATTVGCSTKRHRPQNDREDWLVTDQNEPIEPLDKKTWLREGRSIDPADIPAELIPLSGVDSVR